MPESEESTPASSPGKPSSAKTVVPAVKSVTEPEVLAACNEPSKGDQIPGAGHWQRGLAFRMCIAAICLSSFLTGIDMSAVATALPTITKDLKGANNFIWVGAAYILANTASIPLSGALADAFGRRSVVIGALIMFGVGSALTGAAQNMNMIATPTDIKSEKKKKKKNMIIAARVVQGVSGGSIRVMTDILISDLVPLAQRGTFQGLVGSTWAVAAGMGPPIGGVFSGNVSWR